MRLRADEKGYLCFTLSTMPLVGCTTQHRDELEEEEEDDDEPLRLLAALSAASLYH